jgi:hypothetical protein
VLAQAWLLAQGWALTMLMVMTRMLWLSSWHAWQQQAHRLRCCEQQRVRRGGCAKVVSCSLVPLLRVPTWSCWLTCPGAHAHTSSRQATSSTATQQQA